MKKTADIKLGYECNDHCVHCVVEELRDAANKEKRKRNTQEYKNEVIKSKKNGCKAITVTGGEPTIRYDFLELIKFISDEGLRTDLQSNGRKFENFEFAKESSKYIGSYLIALHGHNSQIHDKITQKKGSFNETVEGIKNLVKLKTNISGKIVLSIYNYKFLLETLKLYEKLGIKMVTISFPHSSGHPEYIRKIAPYYSDLKQYIEKSLEYYSDINKLCVILEDIHLCALDKQYPIIHFHEYFQNFGKKRELKSLLDKTRNWEQVRKSIKRKDEKCAKCLLSNWCDGYWKEYIDERGFTEFNPITKIDKNILFKYDIEYVQQFLQKLNPLYK